MPDPRIYATPEAFRQALGERLKQYSQEREIELNRLYKQVAFERLLARLFDDDNPRWLLKGGYAMELWLSRAARSTRDIDISIPYATIMADKNSGDMEFVRELLQEKAAQDLGDFFQFFIGEKIFDLDNAPAGGARLPVESRVAGRKFTAFHMDVGLGDKVVGQPEWLKGHELLSFAGIAPARVALIPRAQQFAEKMHALTKPRGETTGSRVRDLADLVLLIGSGLPEPVAVVKAVRATFDRRESHPIPKSLMKPPEEWEPVYAKLAHEYDLPVPSFNEAFDQVKVYWQKLFQN